jgi:hypothetical protein
LFQTDEPPSPNHSPFRKSTGEVDFPPRADGNAKGVQLRFVSLASYLGVPKIRYTEPRATCIALGPSHTRHCSYPAE